MPDTYIPAIDDDLCMRCYACIGECPKGVFEEKNGIPMTVNPSDCEYCGSCKEICPAGAISYIIPGVSDGNSGLASKLADNL